MANKFIGIIPARYASSRFPGKPLADLGGMSMIERVYRRVSDVLPSVAVATDDNRIGEAAALLESDADVVINIQGDEPFIAKSQIEALMGCFNDGSVEIASLARPFDPAMGFDALFDPNLVKVVMDDRMNALYFSRSIIPYVRNVEWKQWLENASFHTHVGLYGYRRATLEKLGTLPQSPLEIAESLEQLRWLQAGYKIRMAITEEPTIGIDTPADLEAAREFLKNNSL